jgi:hypothetical protein
MAALPDGRITTDTQTGYLLALAFDLLPGAARAADRASRRRTSATSTGT